MLSYSYLGVGKNMWIAEPYSWVLFQTNEVLETILSDLDETAYLLFPLSKMAVRVLLKVFQKENWLEAEVKHRKFQSQFNIMIKNNWNGVLGSGQSYYGAYP